MLLALLVRSLQPRGIMTGRAARRAAAECGGRGCGRTLQRAAWPVRAASCRLFIRFFERLQLRTVLQPDGPDREIWTADMDCDPSMMALITSECGQMRCSPRVAVSNIRGARSRQDSGASPNTLSTAGGQTLYENIACWPPSNVNPAELWTGRCVCKHACCVCDQMCTNCTVVSQARPHKSANTQLVPRGGRSSVNPDRITPFRVSSCSDSNMRVGVFAKVRRVGRAAADGGRDRVHPAAGAQLLPRRPCSCVLAKTETVLQRDGPNPLGF